jgi:hypothetical protein
VRTADHSGAPPHRWPDQRVISHEAMPFGTGFTGTPLFKQDEITKRIFGNYVSRYDFKRSEEDGALGDRRKILAAGAELPGKWPLARLGTARPVQNSFREIV